MNKWKYIWIEIIFSEVTLLRLACNVIDWKAISRFILNSWLYYNVVAGMRSYNYCNTNRQAERVRKRGGEVAYTWCCASRAHGLNAHNASPNLQPRKRLTPFLPGDGVPVLGQTSHAAHQVRGLCVIWFRCPLSTSRRSIQIRRHFPSLLPFKHVIRLLFSTSLRTRFFQEYIKHHLDSAIFPRSCIECQHYCSFQTFFSAFY